jgi:Fe-S-cluster containining protein
MADTPTQDKILKEFPRLKADDTFLFRCGKDLPCFTHCCKDVTIVLTPYDVLRLKHALRIDSTEFLNRHALLPTAPDQRVPLVLLRMEGEEKRCPFVGAEGCGVYAHRPWACRMYPLGLAEPRTPTTRDNRFYFLLREDLCRGHGAGETLSVRRWIEEQGIEDYDRMGAAFRDLMLEEFWQKGEPLSPEKRDMYVMALYDLDRFRRFVLETSFLKRFTVDEERVEVMKSDDEELLEFAVQWIRFCLLGQKTMRMRPEAPETVRQKAAGAPAP